MDLAKLDYRLKESQAFLKHLQLQHVKRCKNCFSDGFREFTLFLKKFQYKKS